ncbi:unnamed protein product [Caenorhabditis bovis]|uniref:Uncharacterized protein n=1 Tax=Caenorhabditis bovis TaxID=2654633 RepID=A0A8S1EY51_9PELO|nr:unnamed protein product [Caenorhabditis bovis]
METNSVEDEERRRKSEAARRAAIRERIERQKLREKQIAEDIANVDKKSSKRIVFDDDSDEEQEAVEKAPKKPKLFDSDDEEGEEGKEEEELLIKNRHSGVKGEKLMKLETRFNNDPRFKMDDKFAESDESEADEAEIRMEKEKNRELLSKILGKSIGDDSKSKKKIDGSVARPFTRFDPLNEEHVAWMKQFGEKQEKKKKKEEDAGQNDEDADEEEQEEEEERSGEEECEKKEIFYELDEKFSTELKELSEGKKSENGFSFLEMIGRKHDEEDAEAESTIRPEIPKEKPSEIDVTKPLLATSTVKSTRFFVDASDEQIRSMAMNFRRTQSIEKIIDRWTPHRDAIFKVWKKQRRDALKIEKEKMSWSGNRKRKSTGTIGQ